MASKSGGPPPEFREGHSGDLACPHRDISCCDACAKKHPEIVDVYGQHFWIADPKERAKLQADMRKDDKPKKKKKTKEEDTGGPKPVGEPIFTIGGLVVQPTIERIEDHEYKALRFVIAGEKTSLDLYEVNALAQKLALWVKMGGHL